MFVNKITLLQYGAASVLLGLMIMYLILGYQWSTLPNVAVYCIFYFQISFQIMIVIAIAVDGDDPKLVLW